MASDVLTDRFRGVSLLFAWRRVRFTLGVSLLFGFLEKLTNESPLPIVLARYLIVGFVAMILFGLFEQWPKRLPRRVPRSVLQLLSIAVSIPISAAFAYIVTTSGNPNFEHDEKRVMGYASLVVKGLLFAPWIAVGAMLRQRNAFARDQALAFEFEKSELERKASEAHLRLLQAQVEPHFLFNTLANVQALVDAGSPQASKVLASLIAYLRAAVPRMHEPLTPLDQELDLVRAYLDVMQMRMPDRLQFTIRSDRDTKLVSCPPMSVLTLVENAVRHGIDPSEQGGRIDIDAALQADRCIVRVTDTGMGMKTQSTGLGTGLATLRERLQLAFGGTAFLRLSEVLPHGVCAEIDLPVRRAST